MTVSCIYLHFKTTVCGKTYSLGKKKKNRRAAAKQLWEYVAIQVESLDPASLQISVLWFTAAFHQGEKSVCLFKTFCSNLPSLDYLYFLQLRVPCNNKQFSWRLADPKYPTVYTTWKARAKRFWVEKRQQSFPRYRELGGNRSKVAGLYPACCFGHEDQ